jgi:hypothetical protein
VRRENVCDRRRKCKKKRDIYEREERCMREREKVCVSVKEQKSKERGS